jgi:Tol biopolymer transport system component
MTQLTTDPAPDWDPRWSPDGSEIAFYAYRSGNRDVWVMPSRGGPARQLTSDPAQDSDPTWSSDGRQIAFLSGRARETSVWIVNAKGGEARSVAAGGSGESFPDGHAFLISREGRLYRVAQDGGTPSPLPPTGEEPSKLRFARDGRSIYYSVISGPREKHDFWRLSLADGKVSRLTKLEGRRGNIGDAFATDGRYLYFNWREDDGDIWVMDVATDVGK